MVILITMMMTTMRMIMIMNINKVMADIIAINIQIQQC